MTPSLRRCCHRPADTPPHISHCATAKCWTHSVARRGDQNVGHTQARPSIVSYRSGANSCASGGLAVVSVPRCFLASRLPEVWHHLSCLPSSHCVSRIRPPPEFAPQNSPPRSGGFGAQHNPAKPIVRFAPYDLHSPRRRTIINKSVINAAYIRANDIFGLHPTYHTLICRDLHSAHAAGRRQRFRTRKSTDG